MDMTRHMPEMMSGTAPFNAMMEMFGLSGAAARRVKAPPDAPRDGKHEKAQKKSGNDR